MNETVEFSLAQVIGVWKGDAHQIKNLVHNDLPAKAREITVLMATTNVVEDTITSPTPSYQLEQKEDGDADLNQAKTSLKKAHHSYQADQGGPTQSDDHAIPCDYYSGPPDPQPGSYPSSANKSPANTPCMLNYKAAL